MPEGILDRETERGIARDVRLVERAIRNRWPIPENIRQALINRQVTIAIDPKSKPADATCAFKAILAAEQQNQADQKREDEKVEPPVTRVLHVHDLGPVTAENLEEHRRRRIDRINENRGNGSGLRGDRSTVCVAGKQDA